MSPDGDSLETRLVYFKKPLPEALFTLNAPLLEIETSPLGVTQAGLFEAFETMICALVVDDPMRTPAPLTVKSPLGSGTSWMLDEPSKARPVAVLILAENTVPDKERPTPFE